MSQKVLQIRNTCVYLRRNDKQTISNCAAKVRNFLNNKEKTKKNTKDYERELSNRIEKEPGEA